MHMRLLAGSAAVVMFASVVACSSSKSADPTATDDPAQTAADPGAGDGKPAAQAAAQQPPASDAPPAAAADDGGSPDGAAADNDAAGGGGGGGGAPNAQCEATSIHESGSNDTEATANAIPAATGTYCGSLDTAADVDVVTFTLPAGTKSLGFGLSYDAQGIEVEGSAGGETFLVGGKPAFKPGQKYVLKVRSTGATSVSYRLSVDIKP